MSIGERIKALRLKRGMKQTGLADAVGIQKQTLYKYEKSVIVNIPLKTIEALARALDVSPAYLVGWDTGEE